MGNYIIHNGVLYDADALCHYGVKGMKWGVRRYQNADGSLTDAGKKRIKESGSYMKPLYKGKALSYNNRHVRSREALVEEYWNNRVPSLDEESRLAVAKNYFDKYVDATLSDLRLKNTDQAKGFVKQHLMYNKNGELTRVGKDIVEIDRRDKIKAMPEKDRQKLIDKVNAEYKKKWDKLNKLYTNPNNFDKRSKLELEFDAVDAAWEAELYKLGVRE